MTQNTVRVASWVVVAMMAQTVMGADWPQWLGPERNGISSEVPQKLPEKKVLWRRPMSGESHGGIAVAAGFVVVPDFGEGKEIIRCSFVPRKRPGASHPAPSQQYPERAPRVDGSRGRQRRVGSEARGLNHE